MAGAGSVRHCRGQLPDFAVVLFSRRPGYHDPAERERSVWVFSASAFRPVMISNDGHGRRACG